MGMIGDFYESVVLVAAVHGYSVTSGFRTVLHNTAVGGSETSRHRNGLAVDLVPDQSEAMIVRRTPAALLRDLEDLGYWCLDEGDHIHVQVKRLARPG